MRAYTKTISDIEAGIGNRAKAGQTVGNFNNLFMLRVRETATAELLTEQLPKVDIYSTTLVSGATDASDPSGNTDFTSNTQDRVSSTSVPLIEPTHIVSLPKGQALALIVGGNFGRCACRCQHPIRTKSCPRTCRRWPSICVKAIAMATDNRGRRGRPERCL